MDLFHHGSSCAQRSKLSCTLEFAYFFPNVGDDCAHNFIIDGTQGLVQAEIQYGELIDGSTEHSNHQRSEGDYIQHTTSLQY